MTQRQSFAVLISHLLLSLAVLTAATVLTALHDLDAQATVALFAAAIGLLGGTAQQLGGQVINGGPKPNLDKLAATAPQTLTAVMAQQSGRPESPLPQSGGTN